MKIKWIFSCC